MDELIDILDSEGNATGRKGLKSEAHQKGWFHATVHVWIYTSNKKILLQKRALTKKVFPGIWDISVAGHIAAGESILSAAKREVFEEIGLHFKDHHLTKIGTRIHQVAHTNGIQDNEHHHVFIGKLTAPLSTLKIQEEEVADIKLFDLEILLETEKHHNILLPQFHEYYANVYDKIYALGQFDE